MEQSYDPKKSPFQHVTALVSRLGDPEHNAQTIAEYLHYMRDDPKHAATVEVIRQHYRDLIQLGHPHAACWARVLVAYDHLAAMLDETAEK